ncbi:MAG: tetratricopeptide repeat protein [Bryobacteraceae bacterium]
MKHAATLGFLAIIAFTPFAHAQAQDGQPAESAACALLKRKGDAGATACYEKLLRSNNPAAVAEAMWALGNFRGANDAFRATVKLREKDPAPRTRWARMYLDHWQRADAADLLKEALELKENYAPALVAMAIMSSENYEADAIKFAEKALAADPKYLEAQEVIAQVHLEDNNPEKAAEAAKKALQMSEESLDGYAILGTIDLLNDKKDTPWFDRALKYNPKYGEAYATAAHFFIINRRYEEGIELYKKALALDPSLNHARSDLGVNLMRLGQEDEARKHLEQCYSGGYQSPETVNSLRLLDSYKDYVTFKTPTTVLRLHKKEATLLRPYFQSEFDRALATYEKKYKFKLQKPVQIEVYPNHEDFAVRTVSMPGLGALGVTFGYMVAMDSPSGRKPGAWHWASTMWHELSHVYVLEMTNHRVPRWFTEGMAVYEETATSPDWGDRLDPGSIAAIKGKKLLPIAELDRGFIHPTGPEQVTVSYFQGGKICNFIAEKWGWEKLLAMIHDFGANMTTVAVIEKELQLKPEEFDKQFLAWLEPQTKKTVDGFDDWRKSIRGVATLAKETKWDEVISIGLGLRDVYPDYVEAGNAYEFLAQAYKAKGDTAKQTAELERYSKIGGRDPELLKQLAVLQTEQGRKKDAASTLERLNLIYLEDEPAHQQLGNLYLDLKEGPGAVREFQALLAGKPVDVAGAHYGLAQAFVLAMRNDDAREEVVSALEAAPGFKPAQKLLLELSGKE